MNHRIFAQAVLSTGLCLTQSAPSRTCSPDWEIVPSPSVAGKENVLTSVAVIAEDDAWAVGYSYAGNEYETLTLHWDGVRWTKIPSPSLSSHSLLLGVSASATDDVWAVGNVFDPAQMLIEHWDGAQWTVVPSPDPGGSPRLNAVTALAPDDAWAVGQTGPLAGYSDPLFVHWDGQTWTVAPSPPNAAGRLAVTAVSTNDIWSTGPSRLRDNSALFTHWDGASWTVVPNPPMGADDFVSMTGISAVASNDVWAVGQRQSSDCFGESCIYWENGIVERWDGATWSPAPPPLFYTNARAVTTQSAQSIWVTGNDPSNQVSRWDGTSWTGVRSLGSFASLASAPSGDVWAVASIRASTLRTLIARYSCR